MSGRPEVKLLDLQRQFAPIRKSLDAASSEAIASGWYLLGQRGETFCAEFARWLGVSGATGCANGTDALTLALLALGVGEGDEVITVANSAFATATGVERCGARAVFVDIDPDRWLIDPERVRAAVTPRTKAVVPVHLFGHAADLPALRAAAPGIPFVEDCAQAHGTTLDGRKVGTFTEAASFSFYPSKNLGALGDAGAVVSADAALLERVRGFRFYGQAERDVHTHIGLNSRLDELLAAMLSVCLRELDGWLARRRAIAARYDAAFADSGLRRPQLLPGSDPSYHLYVVRTAERDRFRGHLAEAGIQTGIHYVTPIPRQPVYADRGLATPVSDALAQEIVSLPIAPHLTDQEVDRVIDACQTFEAAR